MTVEIEIPGRAVSSKTPSSVCVWKDFKCELCGEKAFTSESHLKVHTIRSHINPSYLSRGDLILGNVTNLSILSEQQQPKLYFHGLYRCHLCHHLWDVKEDLITHLNVCTKNTEERKQNNSLERTEIKSDRGCQNHKSRAAFFVENENLKYEMFENESLESSTQPPLSNNPFKRKSLSRLKKHSSVVSIDDLLGVSPKSFWDSERTTSVINSVLEDDTPFTCLNCEDKFTNFILLTHHKELGSCKSFFHSLDTKKSFKGEELHVRRRQILQDENLEQNYIEYISKAVSLVPETTFNNMDGTLRDIKSLDGIFLREKQNAFPGALTKVQMNFSGPWTTREVWECGGWEFGGSPYLSWNKYQQTPEFIRQLSFLHWNEQLGFKRAYEVPLRSLAKKRNSTDSPRKSSRNILSLLELKRSFKCLRKCVKYTEERVRFNGEWELSHVFMCSVCAQSFGDLEEVMHHKWEAHPYCLVSHVTLPSTLKLPPESFKMYPQIGRQMLNLNKSNLNSSSSYTCSKCYMVLRSSESFYIHILTCGGDFNWAHSSKKKRRRRGHGGGLKSTVNRLNTKNLDIETARILERERRQKRLANFLNPEAKPKSSRMTRHRAHQLKEEERKKEEEERKRDKERSKHRKKMPTRSQKISSENLPSRLRRSKVNYARDESLRLGVDKKFDLSQIFKRTLPLRIEAVHEETEKIRDLEAELIVQRILSDFLRDLTILLFPSTTLNYYFKESVKKENEYKEDEKIFSRKHRRARSINYNEESMTEEEDTELRDENFDSKEVKNKRGDKKGRNLSSFKNQRKRRQVGTNDFSFKNKKKKKKEDNQCISSHENKNKEITQGISRHNFSLQIKVQAIQRILEGEKQVTVAKDLQCPKSTIATWWQKRQVILSLNDVSIENVVNHLSYENKSPFDSSLKEKDSGENESVFEKNVPQEEEEEEDKVQITDALFTKEIFNSEDVKSENSNQNNEHHHHHLSNESPRNDVEKTKCNNFFESENSFASTLMLSAIENSFNGPLIPPILPRGSIFDTEDSADDTFSPHKILRDEEESLYKNSSREESSSNLSMILNCYWSGDEGKDY